MHDFNKNNDEKKNQEVVQIENEIANDIIYY